MMFTARHRVERLAGVTIRVAAVAALVIAAAPTASAANPGPVNFPMIGIGQGQTLRLNAVAVQPGPTQDAASAGCDAILSFADRNGNAVGPAPARVSLGPGQGTFFDYRALSSVAGRQEIRPVVTYLDGGRIDCGFAAEVFNQLGFTQFLSQPGPPQLPGSDAGPSQAFSLLGVGLAQVARLSAVAVNPGPQQSPAADLDTPPGPCLVSLGFVDVNGVPVGVNPGPQQIGPGHAAFLDFAAGTQLQRFGQRVEVRPVVTVDAGLAASPCAGVETAVETFDLITNATWAFAQPGISDFAISVTPPAQGLVAGSSVLFSVQTSIVVGTPGQIALSVGNLPPGTTASFNPPAVSPGGKSTLVVTASTSAPNGLWTLTIGATAGSVTHTASAAIVINGGSQP